ncbi:ABC transporter ATP-binding protein [candidate division KSB1 bacterium]|nr:ABC transporter ATP-binding protein [candidate division KSB1 bacterium]
MKDLLEIKNLCVEVDGKELLHDINLAIPEGEIHTLLGPNGSGKTTLIMTVMGFTRYQVTRGRIFYDGQDITDLDLTARARLGIGVMQQRPPTIAGVKLHQVLAYLAAGDLQRNQKVQELLNQSQMSLIIDRDLNAGLSGGEIKRSELLQLLAHEPKFAMMDEPDSGVDLESLALIGKMINKLFAIESACTVKRKAGLIITHTGYILDNIDADKAHIMLAGRISCSGNPHLVLEIIKKHGYEGCVHCMP